MNYVPLWPAQCDDIAPVAVLPLSWRRSSYGGAAAIPVLLRVAVAVLPLVRGGAGVYGRGRASGG
jgi:hypothetical protein